MFGKFKLFKRLLGKMSIFYENANYYGVDIANTTVGYYWEKQLKERLESPECLEQYGYKVFSQNDEDGIIAEIFRRIGTTNKLFVEFGVGEGLECNSHYLLHLGWKGLWIEGDPRPYKNISTNFKNLTTKETLKIVNDYVTVDNINDILIENNIEGNIDLLSIDIDGNDYHIFEAITCIDPRVIIIEYNAKFPPDCDWVMPYDETYIWDGSDKQGASLSALTKLANRKGYQLIGTNYNGVNAFYVRLDLIKDKMFASPARPEKLYNPRRQNICYKSTLPSREYLVSADIDAF